MDAGTFPDGEIDVKVDARMRGEQVFIVQPTSAPAERHLFELCLLADACRRAGASEITAVIPYFGYARHDRRASPGGAIGARVAADLLAAAHIDRIVSVDVHCGNIEGLASARFEHVTALGLLLAAIVEWPRDRGVVVSPDLGAVKLAQRVGRALDAPVAIVHKTRLSGLAVEAQGLAGDVRDRLPLIVDDMISTGGTIEAAARAVLAAGCAQPLTVLATHGLFVGPAFERLASLPIARVLVTDSVPAAGAAPVSVERVPLAAMLAEVVRCLHAAQPISPDLIAAR